MTESGRPTHPAWLAAFQLALIVSSIVLVVLPRLYAGAVVPLFCAAAVANYAILIRREWRSGRLRMTLTEMYERARGGDRLPRQTIAMCASVACSIALWSLPMS